MATILDIKVHWWEEYLLFPMVRLVEFITWRIPFEIKAFIQRGRRGWADSDLWDLEDYLARIISETLPALAKEHHGCPLSIKSDKEWKKWLKDMAKTFKDYREIENKFKGKHWIKEYNGHIEKMRKLFDHFGSLWD